MLWLVNHLLHVFGWAIVIETDWTPTGETRCAYPVRAEWRGFPHEREELGYTRVSEWIAKAGSAIAEEAKRK